MKGLEFFKSPASFLELGHSSLTLLKGDEWLELPLERLHNGRLTPACKQQLTLRLQGLFKHNPWQPRPRVFCALGARGVSLRRLTLPPTAKESVPRLLRLQIESEFPLPPDELAWGYQPLPHSHSSGNSFPGQQEFLVVALRKESVEDYAEIFAACGVNAAFTLGASARSYLCPQALGSYAMLDIGSTQSELSCFENGIPSTLRILPWGDGSFTQKLVETVGLTQDEAETIELKLGKPALGDGQPEPKIESALAILDELIGYLNGHLQAQKLYLTGRSVDYPNLAAHLTKRLASGIVCEALSPVPGHCRSAAVLGLETAAHNGGANALLLLQAKPASQHAGSAVPIPWKLVRLTALLALSLVALPYLEAFALKPLLARKLSSLNADRARLPIIDNELAFLQELKLNQPPYLDALFILAKAAAAGTRIDSLSMNRRGELSLRGSMQNSQQVTDFRSKLIESGFFSSVTVDEQSPGAGPGGMPGLGGMPGGPGGQKVVVRMTAQWKSPTARLTVAIGPTAEEIEKARTRVRDPQPGMPPMMPGAPPMVSGGPSVMAGGPPGRPMTSAIDGSAPLRISAPRRIIPGNLPDRPQTPGETDSPTPPGSAAPGTPGSSAPAPLPPP